MIQCKALRWTVRFAIRAVSSDKGCMPGGVAGVWKRWQRMYLNVGLGFGVQSSDGRVRDGDHVLKVRQHVLEVLRGVGVEDELLVAVTVHVADHRDHQRSRVVGRGHHLHNVVTVEVTTPHRMTTVMLSHRTTVR